VVKQAAGLRKTNGFSAFGTTNTLGISNQQTLINYAKAPKAAR
jgi:hypothetical protein